MTQSDRAMRLLDAAREAKGAPLSSTEAEAVCRDLGLSRVLHSVRSRVLRRRTAGQLVVRSGEIELVH